MVHPENVNTILGGSSGLFVCAASGNPLPEITWNQNSTVLSNNSRIKIYKKLVTESGLGFVTSTLEACHIEDPSIYSCTARNERGSDVDSFEITVNSDEGGNTRTRLFSIFEHVKCFMSTS